MQEQDIILQEIKDKEVERVKRVLAIAQKNKDDHLVTLMLERLMKIELDNG